MTRNFSVSGAAALLAITACNDASVDNRMFGFGSLGNSIIFDEPGAAAQDPRDSGIQVTVQQFYSRPGEYRYYCTIHQGRSGGVVQ